ncbi:MAG: hypothetical protein M0Z77_05455 [Thermoplasmatales archaeon]|jgi:hypothetical protein|nr:hypothetical protein [Thermoplasmatales archaeon]
MVVDKCRGEEIYGKYKTAIFTFNRIDSVVDSTLKQSKCIVKLANFKEKITDGGYIFTDSQKGIIFK